ncbi:MAG: hypothetical protein JOS17DRAFT_124963 [Linnemannia elongata]|nr:MAG: hypothetical protein JOS17DRAFT_124963 [Linnemannia elongata]
MSTFSFFLHSLSIFIRFAPRQISEAYASHFALASFPLSSLAYFLRSIAIPVLVLLASFSLAVAFIPFVFLYFFPNFGNLVQHSFQYDPSVSLFQSQKVEPWCTYVHKDLCQHSSNSSCTLACEPILHPFIHTHTHTHTQKFIWFGRFEMPVGCR